MDVVIIQLHMFLLSGKGRLDLKNIDRVRDYTREGALQDFSVIVRVHSWDVNNAQVALPIAARKRPRGDSGASA
jgi:hypothetical protein